MARIFRRRFGTIPIVENTVQTLDLPRNHVFKGLLLRVAGTYTISGGTTNGTGLTDESPYSLIKRLRIIRNGSEVLQTLDGGSLERIARVNWGTTNTFGNFAVGISAATPFDFTIPIDFQSMGLVRDSITFLRAVGTSSMQLEITWGAITGDVIIGGDRTRAIDAGQLAEVTTSELMDLSGTFADKQLQIIEKEVTASQDDFVFDLPLGVLYRRVFVKATKNGGNDLDNELVTNLTIKSDGLLNHFDKVNWEALREQNKLQYQLESILAGYAVIDFAEDGNLQGVIDTTGASSFQVFMETNYNGSNGVQKVRVITETLNPSALEL